MSQYDTSATAPISRAGTPPRDARRTCERGGSGEPVGMFSGLPPVPNFVFRLALAFGAGLMLAALL